MAGPGTEVRAGRKLAVQTNVAPPDARFGRTLALFIHGGCAHSGQWREQEHALGKLGVSTLTFDALGCGNSDKPRSWEAYSAEELYKDLQAIFEANRQGFQRVILLGHSFGAVMALRLASEAPELVAGIVLVGAYVPPKEASAPPLFSLARWIFYFPEWVLQWLQPSLTENFIATAFSPETKHTHPELIEQERQHSNSNPPYMFKAFFRQVLPFVNRAAYSRYTASLSQPVLILYGEDDRLTPTTANSAALTRELRSAVLTIVPVAGHQVMQEKPAEVNRAIETFLAKIL